MTLDDCFLMARAIVSACEDFGLEGDTPHREAVKALEEIREAKQTPGLSAAPWIKCSVPQLREWAAECERLGKEPVRVRAYEAIVAVRLLAVETLSRGAVVGRFGLQVRGIIGPKWAKRPTTRGAS